MIDLPIARMTLIIASLALFNLLSLWRFDKKFPVTEFEIAVHLIIDSSALAALLYLSGGSTNPFVSLFLVPIALSASFLTFRYVAAIAIFCIAAYSFLMSNHVHLSSSHGRFGGDFNLHIFGMWVNFILSAIVTMLFVTSLAKSARQRDRQLAESEQQLLKNEHIVAMGTLAAGTAHEIGTPLSNIGMMADELHDSPQDVELVKEFSTAIKQQQQLCKTQLQKLTQTSEQLTDSASSRMPLLHFITDIINRWSAMRPDIRLDTKIDIGADMIVRPDQTIAQAIINLLNNAADASVLNRQPKVGITASTTEDNLLIHIDDHGQGFTEEQLEMAGDISFSTKAEGLGIGLILSHATLRRYDGSLTIQRVPGGVRSTVNIPLSNLIAS
ncbi:MAG: ATP-binding protein [Chromatiales bacterium]